MEITTRVSGDVTILEVRQMLTVDRGVDEFREAVRSLLQEGRRRFLVDMNQHSLEYAAIDAVVDVYGTVSHHGGTIKLMHLRKGFWGGLIGQAKLVAVFDVYDTEAEAIASFGGDKA